MAKNTKQKTPVQQLQEKPDDFLIVGIGASAGGIQALQQFFQQVPADSGMAYIVILHLSPDHDSQLANVLQQTAQIPVAQVQERVKFKPNNIYVVPPDQHLSMEDGYIIVSKNILVEERRAPVDIFFRSLADVHGPRAVAVILSGTGANGSMGMKRIKERGGATFVQNPREAEFNEMPRNSIATELVDQVLPVAEIPASIISFKNNIGVVEIAPENEKRPQDEQQALREIFTQIRVRTGHDFSNYKRPTLLRRIERRINLFNLPDLPAYANYVQHSQNEANALLKDLLISVTNFFRDKNAFEVIEQEIIPVLIKGKTSESQVRIWVAACATGEEAYSLAILFAEKLMGTIDAPKVQIFATDIDEQALATAREGRYTINDLADVSPERLRRFFTKEGDIYCIRREIRESILFANHNFIKDPPFSHLDLVSCRNVMIYLNNVAQERVIETFHFALNPGCFLFLGTSESVDGAIDLFASYNRDYHVFQSRQVSQRTYPVPESVPSFHTKKQFEATTQQQENKVLERISFADLHQQLLEQYAAPSLVINEEYDIVHVSERAGKYLQIGGGDISQNLLKLIRPELRLEVRSALYQATQQQTAVEAKGLKVSVGDKTETVNIHIRPVLREGDNAKGFILVLFEAINEEHGRQEILLSSDEPVAKQLEEELMRVKLQLRSSSEQHDFQAEELKASNEELQAMNEELRSAAEELETSKEELQSINEELRTVNQELKVKIEETSLTSNNLRNLINSTNIATVFLDRSFRVSLFTPAIREIFNLIPADYGRPITDITNRLNYANLVQDAEVVLDKLNIIEREVTTTDNRVFMMRLLPYRTAEDRINGVVVTFFNITERIKQEKALLESEEKFRTLFNSIDEAVAWCEMITDDNGKAVDYRLLELNPAYEKMSGGLTAKGSKGKTGKELVPQLEDFWIETYAKVAFGGEAVRVEHKVEGLNHWFNVYASPVGDKKDGQLVMVYTDVTERKRQEAKQQFLIKLGDIFRSTSDSVKIQAAVTNTFMNDFNADRCYYCEIDGDIATIKQDAHRDGLPSVAAVYNMKNMPVFKNFLQTGKPLIVPDVYKTNLVDDKLKQLCIDSKVISFINLPLIKNNKLVGRFCVTQVNPREWSNEDIDLATETAERTWVAVEKANAEEALRVSEEKYRAIFNSINEGFCLLDIQFDGKGEAFDVIIVDANPAQGKIDGVRAMIGKSVRATIPNIELKWIQRYANIIKSGQSEYFEDWSEANERWYEVHATRVGSEGSTLVAIIYNDITERKWLEKRQQYLIQLNDALRTFSNPDDILQEALKTVGEYLNLDRVVYNEIDPEVTTYTTRVNYLKPGFTSVVGILPMAPFRETVRDLEKGIIYIQRDAERDGKLTEAEKQACRSIQVQAFVTVPLIKKERWVCNLVAHYHKPRNWTAHEIAILEETAERIWSAVEKANAEEALHLSEQRLQRMVNIPFVGVLTFNYNGKMLNANDAFLEMVGYSRLEFEADKLTWQHFTPAEYVRASEEVMLQLQETGTGGPYEKEYFRKDGTKVWLLFVAADLKDGVIVEYVIDISERKQVEEFLRRSEERLQLATNAASMGTFVYYPQEDRGEPDKQMLSLFGLPPDGVLNLSEALTKIIHKDDRDRYKEDVLRATNPAGNGNLDSDIRIIHPDGSIHWINISAQTYFAGEPPYAVKMPGVAIDITERKKIAEALQESEERLRVTMDSSIDYAIITTDINGNIEGWSNGAEQTFYYTKEEAEGKPVAIIFTPEDVADNVPQQEMITAREKGMAADERWHQRKDGSRFYMSGVMRPIYNPELSGYVKVARDMTKEQQAQENLKMLEERNRIALESGQMAAWDWLVYEDSVSWNDQHFLILGVQPNDKPMNSGFFFHFIHKDDLEKVGQALRTAIEETGLYAAEFRILREDDGEIRWMSGFGKAVTKKDGHATRMVGVMFDITERKRLEQQKEDFISIASHELKTPVTSIKAYTEVLHEIFSESADAGNAQLMKKMDAQVDRLIDLIRVLLDTSKLAEGELTLHLEKFDLCNLVSQRVRDLQQLSTLHHIKIINQSEEIIHADPHRIGQVLNNFISNAIKYSPKGGDVVVECKQANDYVQVSVKDEGIGISKEMQTKVFDRFFRVKSDEMKNLSGMGLGLYVTANIIYKHGGNIWVESEVGKGSTFYFTIPVNTAN